MTVLLTAATDLRTWGLILLVFGLLPGLTLRMLVRLYPPGHERRMELVGELYVLPYWRRPLFVAEQLETALFEGTSLRLAQRALRRSKVGSATQAREEILVGDDLIFGTSRRPPSGAVVSRQALSHVIETRPQRVTDARTTTLADRVPWTTVTWDDGFQLVCRDLSCWDNIHGACLSWAPNQRRRAPGRR